MRRHDLLLCAALALGCKPSPTHSPSAPSPPGPGERAGSAREVDPGGSTARPTIPVEDPTEGPVGRVPRRLDADQLRASLAHATGALWTEDRRERSFEDPSGYALSPSVDLLQRYAGALGEPDYGAITEPNLEVSAGFVRLALSAAGATCRAGVTRDLGTDPARRVLLRTVAPGDLFTTAPNAVRANLVALGRRFWARALNPEGAEVRALLVVFRDASERPGGSAAEGWIAACVALATDPQFLLY